MTVEYYLEPDDKTDIYVLDPQKGASLYVLDTDDLFVNITSYFEHNLADARKVLLKRGYIPISKNELVKLLIQRGVNE